MAVWGCRLSIAAGGCCSGKLGRPKASGDATTFDQFLECERALLEGDGVEVTGSAFDDCALLANDTTVAYGEGGRRLESKALFREQISEWSACIAGPCLMSFGPLVHADFTPLFDLRLSPCLRWRLLVTNKHLFTV